MKNSRHRSKIQAAEVLYEIGIVSIAAVLFGVSVNMFLVPADIVIGGATGISTVLNHLFGFPIGVTILLINLPLILINLKVFGISFCLKTIIGVGAVSLASDLLTFLPVTITDPLLCSLFGAATMGIAMGLLFSRGYTTGGTDLIVWLLKLKFRRISTGKLVMICDLIIILGAAFILSSYEGIFYSVITAYLLSKMTDYTLSGAEKACVVIIISEHHEEIAQHITQDLQRGITAFDAKGWYSGKDKKVLLCAVKKSEIYRIRTLIKQCDPEAFWILAEAGEVIGEGFRPSDALN